LPSHERACPGREFVEREVIAQSEEPAWKKNAAKVRRVFWD
jgi:hypothetical protein